MWISLGGNGMIVNCNIQKKLAGDREIDIPTYKRCLKLAAMSYNCRPIARKSCDFLNVFQILLSQEQNSDKPRLQISATQSYPISCMTSGAIQYGVPITYLDSRYLPRSHIQSPV